MIWTSGPSDSWATVDCGLMPAEPHIRSPFPERLAPQSLILGTVRPPGSNGADQALVELAECLSIGLGRAGPPCISAYHSHCLAANDGEVAGHHRDRPRRAAGDRSTAARAPTDPRSARRAKRSAAMRYWNLARQRRKHSSARCCWALRVSADRALSFAGRRSCGHAAELHASQPRSPSLLTGAVFRAAENEWVWAAKTA
jgi:hypothetical protein